ncbi:hypothetical protein LDENG_00159940, partial [Lucifuga dentata]
MQNGWYGPLKPLKIMYFSLHHVINDRSLQHNNAKLCCMHMCVCACFDSCGVLPLLLVFI